MSLSGRVQLSNDIGIVAKHDDSRLRQIFCEKILWLENFAGFVGRVGSRLSVRPCNYKNNARFASQRSQQDKIDSILNDTIGIL